jgi:hypothetical protein
MENVAQYSNSLVYPSSSTPGTRSHEDDNPVNASSAWLSGQRSASNSSTSSTQLSSIYSAVDRPPDHGDYASTSTSYGQVQPNDSYSNYSQPSNIRPEDDGNHSATIALSPQISGSIGPSRLTRRQTRAQSTLHLGLRRDRPPAPSNVQSDLHGADEVRHKSYFAHHFILLITSFTSLPTTCHQGAPCRALRHLQAVATQIATSCLTECLSQWARVVYLCNHLGT